MCDEVLRHWVVVVGGALLGGLACGGSTKASNAEGGTTASSGSGGETAVPGEAGQGGELGTPSGAGIVPDALEGCRGPSDAGCEVCYFSADDGRSCTRESGGDRDYVDYVGLDGACPC